jgi:hypothetical protein
VNGHFSTTQIPTTHLYQNHLDKIQQSLDIFCKNSRSYRWGILSKNQKLHGLTKVDDFLQKHNPEKISYFTETQDGSRKLAILIDNGITVNLKNGDYQLLGLYHFIVHEIGNLKTQKLLVFIRRYWLINILVSIWIIPALILIVLHQVGYAIVWAIFYLFILLKIFTSLPDDFTDSLETSDIILDTKISYGIYRDRLGSPFYAFLTSAKTIISAIATLATIISTILFFTRQ